MARRRRRARVVPRHPGIPRRSGARGRRGDRDDIGLLVHLRRPSRLSTWTLSDTQPFDDPAGRFAFSHNGDLRDYKDLRATYRAAGRIHGRADTEVGERWLEDAWQPDEPRGLACWRRSTSASAGGPTSRVLTADGTAYHYAGNDENPVFAFRLGRIGIASTGIYSLDRSLFRFVAPAATDRKMVRLHTGVTLGPDGRHSVVN